MNRSFLYGIIVASTTWCISLYLYWVLVHSTPESMSSSLIASNIMVSSIGEQSPNRKNSLVNHDQLIGSDDGKRAYADKQKSYLYQKYKKGKTFRKMSRKMIDDLQPVQIDAGKGEFCLLNNKIPVCRIENYAFLVDEFGMVRNAEEQYLRDIGYKRHAFNILVSNKIGLIRDIPDTRNKLYVLHLINRLKRR